MSKSKKKRLKKKAAAKKAAAAAAEDKSAHGSDSEDDVKSPPEVPKTVESTAGTGPPPVLPPLPEVFRSDDAVGCKPVNT